MPLPFGIGKKAKKEGKGEIPIERIKDLSSKGFSEPEIIDILRREGYSAEEIDKGFIEVLKGGVVETSKVQKEEARPEPKEEKATLPEIEELLRGEEKEEKLEVPETSLPSFTQSITEEYVEYLTDQKLIEVYQRFEDIYYRIEELEKIVKEIEVKVENLSKQRFVESEELIKKVEGFSEGLQVVSGRVGSLEKAFKETLPSLVDAIKSLNESLKKR